jgi:hypothetical protein
LPALETIVCDPDDVLPGIGWLCAIVRERKAMGHPLRTIRVPHRNFADERGKWLRANVEVEVEE